MKRFKKVAAIMAIMFLLVPAIKAQANAFPVIDENDPVPLDVRIACDFWGQYYNICPELLEAIAFHESRYNAGAENGSCKGLMQINIKAHEDRLKRLEVESVYDLECNVMVAADYLAELFATYEDVAVVLAIYHGEANAQEKAEAGYISGYVTNILQTSADLERAHGK